jgi:anti-sigma factor RsiW
VSASEHLDDVLSAYLDDELAPDERRGVDAHLAACPECRSDLEAERDVRQLVRDLPAVDPPFGFYERMLRDGPEESRAPAKRRRFRFGLANIAATAAAWLLILGVANLHNNGSVDPAPQGYVKAASVIPSFGGGSQQQSHEEAKSHDVPDQLAGTYQLVGYTEMNGLPQYVYSDGERTLSVFLRPGELDENSLPADASPTVVNGVPAWEVSTEDAEVVFVQQPGVVVVIVGPAPDAAASDVAGSNGPHQGGESLADRVTGAATGLLETFGLRG